MSGFSEFLGGFGRTFGAAYAEKQDRKQRREEERLRREQQDKQFAQNMELQRAQLEAAKAHTSFLEGIMGREQGLKERQDFRAGELHDFEKQRLGELFDPAMVAGRKASATSGFDAEYAKNLSFLRTLPIEERRAKLREAMDRADISAKNLETRMRRYDADTRERLQPYADAMTKASAREADARAKKAGYETSDSAFSGMDADREISRARAHFEMARDLGLLAEQAERRKLSKIHINDAQIEAFADRVDKMIQAGVPPDVAKKAVTDAYIAGTAFFNKPVAEKMGATEADMQKAMAGYHADLADVLQGTDPAKIKESAARMRQSAAAAIKAIQAYDADNPQTPAPTPESQPTGEQGKSKFQTFIEGQTSRGISQKGAEKAAREAGVGMVPVGGKWIDTDNSSFGKNKEKAYAVDEWARSHSQEFTDTIDAFVAKHGGNADSQTYERFKKWIVDEAARSGHDPALVIQRVKVDLRIERSPGGYNWDSGRMSMPKPPGSESPREGERQRRGL